MMTGAEAAGLFQDPSSHHEALIRLAAKYLGRGQFQAAFRFADRRCRIIPRADARTFLLRGEALLGLGETGSAERDFSQAFSLDPTDPFVNRRALQSTDRVKRDHAARLIVAAPSSDRQTVRLALEALWLDAVEAAGALWFESGVLQGWLAWRDFAELHIRIDVISDQGRSEALTLLVRGDVDHALASDSVRAADLRLPILLGAPCKVTVSPDGHECLRSVIHLRINARSASIGRRAEPFVRPQVSERARRTTVIVPVYGDPEMTRRCLSSLGSQFRATPELRAIIVNDKPGDLEIDALIKEMARRFRFELLINDYNLGFVGSVNKALAETGDDDVVLLNSDVILTDGAIERLRDVAVSNSDIGTLTPLSNNGELTSFPYPFQANPLEKDHAIWKIDRIAARVNHARVVDLPNGIGFCLYITRACLAAVGNLSGSYSQGYYEDVDFCLRAQALGFRNVCACNVYVGHKGSGSFKEDKRALVVRNLRILTRRFPDFPEASAAFILADPLRAARAAIELTWSPRAIATLVVAGTDQVALAESRSKDLIAAGIGVMILLIPFSSDSGKVALCVPSKANLQSIDFDTRTAGGLIAFLVYLGRLSLREVEIAYGVPIDETLLNGFRRLGVQLTVLLDGSPVRSPKVPTNGPCPALSGQASPCQNCVTAFETSLQRSSVRNSIVNGKQESLFRLTDRLVALNAMAAAMARQSGMPIIDLNDSSPMVIEQSSRSASAGVLGILYPRANAIVEQLIISLCRHLARVAPSLEIVVLGSAFDDLRLMRIGNTFVTGQVKSEEYGDVLRQYGIGMMFGPERWGGFGLLDRLVREAPCPKAYFDWSFGVMETIDLDLALDPRLCDEKAAHLLASWCDEVLQNGLNHGGR